ncbi:MAG: TRAP transporter small permease [Proteobacteria bacterium]|nr:TRAP transporter small permease [Pseudomonadota bacterium]
MAVATGWVLTAYCFAVGVEIVGRRYLGFSLQGVDEIGGYLMAIVVAFGFSFALYEGAHIRIDLLLMHLPRALAMWLNVAALAGLLVFALFLAWRAWIVFAQSYAIKAVAPTPLLTPMVVPQSVWMGGLLLFVLATLASLVRAVRHGLRGEDEAVAELAGSSASGLSNDGRIR